MDKQLILPEGTNVDTMVIAPATRIGDLLYLSGTAGYDSEKGALAGDDIESQARQAMKNLKRVLDAAGSDWTKVVKVNCFLVHVARDFPGWNKVWKEIFRTNPPARTTVGGGIGMEGALIEVELIATV